MADEKGRGRHVRFAHYRPGEGQPDERNGPSYSTAATGTACSFRTTAT